MLELTCSKIDYDVYEEYRVRKTIEHNPSSWKIVIKEGYGNRKYDKVGNQEQQHTEVPVKSEIKKTQQTFWVTFATKTKLGFWLFAFLSDNKK